MAALWLKQRVAGYAVAAGSVALVSAIKTGFDPFLGSGSPYFLYFGAVMGSAWYGGFRAGLVATILSAFLGHFFFVQPTLVILKPEWGRNFLPVVFFVEGSLICFLCESLCQARGDSERVGNEFRLLVDGTLVLLVMLWTQPVAGACLDGTTTACTIDGCKGVRVCGGGRFSPCVALPRQACKAASAPMRAPV